MLLHFYRWKHSQLSGPFTLTFHYNIYKWNESSFSLTIWLLLPNISCIRDAFLHPNRELCVWIFLNGSQVNSQRVSNETENLLSLRENSSIEKQVPSRGLVILNKCTEIWCMILMLVNLNEAIIYRIYEVTKGVLGTWNTYTTRGGSILSEFLN